MYALSKDILEAIKKAREFFGIKDFPGNFFNLIHNENYIDNYGLLLFREDIGKLSGFIGYGEDDLTVICINYKRPIGHQNFTLAHELGHWFLHKGQAISDDDRCFYSSNKTESEANIFAAEILYPMEIFKEDFQYIMKNGLNNKRCRKELAIFIDVLCHKYCLSFEVVLRKILYAGNSGNKYNIIRKEIEPNLGKKISEFFEKDFYIPNENLLDYQQYRKPYEILSKRIDKLVEEKKIGTATAESIKLRNGLLS